MVWLKTLWRLVTCSSKPSIEVHDPASAVVSAWRTVLVLGIGLVLALALFGHRLSLGSEHDSGLEGLESNLISADVDALLTHARWAAAGSSDAVPAGQNDDGDDGDDGDDDDDDDPKTIPELRERIAEVLDRRDVPGVGVAMVAEGDILWTGGVGMANVATGTEVTDSTVFRVGSISKTIIALAVMSLVEDGRLGLDTPVSEIDPDRAGQNPWAEIDPITIAHLLEHSAGYDDMRFNELYLEPGASDAPLADVLMRNPRTRTSRWRPGTRFAYANPGYTEAAHVVERITGEPFEDYVERRLLRPMGMSTASFRATDDLRERLAQGYSGRRSRPVPYRRIHHRPAGELMASPAEMARLVAMMIARGRPVGGPAGASTGTLGSGESSRESGGKLGAASADAHAAFASREQIVTPGSIARMERSETRPAPLLDSAYGLGIGGDSSLPVLMRGHDGGMPGFLSEYRYSSQLGVGYALLFNSTSPDVVWAFFEIRTLVSQFLLRERELPEPPEVTVPREVLAGYVGYYQLTSPRHELVAFIDRVLWSAEVSLEATGPAASLVLKIGPDTRLRLIPTGPDRFRFPGFSGPGVAFAVAEDGTRVMRLGDSAYESASAWRGRLEQRALTSAYSLLQVGSFWNFLWIPGWLYLLFRIRKRIALPPGAPPALAALCFFAMIQVLLIGIESDALGRVHALSVGFFGLSILFPVLSALALFSTVQSLRQSEQIRMAAYEELAELSGMVFSLYQRGWRSMLYDIAISTACVGMSVYLLLNGIVGLRTWAW